MILTDTLAYTCKYGLFTGTSYKLFDVGTLSTSLYNELDTIFGYRGTEAY